MNKRLLLMFPLVLLLFPLHIFSNDSYFDGVDDATDGQGIWSDNEEYLDGYEEEQGRIEMKQQALAVRQEPVEKQKKVEPRTKKKAEKAIQITNQPTDLDRIVDGIYARNPELNNSDSTESGAFYYWTYFYHDKGYLIETALLKAEKRLSGEGIEVGMFDDILGIKR